MTYISGFDRSQTALFPHTVDELIDENNIVRLVEIFINGVDLNKSEHPFGTIKRQWALISVACKAKERI